MVNLSTHPVVCESVCVSVCVCVGGCGDRNKALRSIDIP